MKYFVYKKAGNNNLYWNYDKTTWVNRGDASLYTEAQRAAIDKVEGASGGRWHEVVAEPVKYGEQPRPIPVIIGDDRTMVTVPGYYWVRQDNGWTNVIHLDVDDAFIRGRMYIYIKEPAWPQ